MLAKKAIAPAESQPNQFLSNIFLTTKRDGRYRPVVNLRNLNKIIPYHKFKLERMKQLKELLQKGDLLVKIDLQDAYLAIPLHQQSQNLVKFRWQRTLFQFLVMCFGIGPAPRVFTKVLKVPISVLRRLNIRLLIYLDDRILMAQSLTEIKIARDTTIFLLEQLGFIVNLKKSVLNPTTFLEFLEVMINSETLTLQLPQKVNCLIQKCQKLLRSPLITLRQLSSVIGTLVSTAPAVFPAPLQYRYLQQQQINSLSQNLSYESMISLNTYSREELKWWITNLKLYNGRPIKIVQPKILITSDAATSGGWGATCQGQCTGGQWDKDEKGLHINILELIAAKLALRTFLKKINNTSVHILMDNTTAISYLLKMGGTKNLTLLEIAKEIWQYLLPKRITLTAEYIPSLLNKGADYQSRNVSDLTEWKLSETIFRRISQIWGLPEIDLFASRLNFQVPKFFSWKPDPLASATDAFQQQWPKGLLFAFPPFCLIGRVIRKAIQDLAELILIAPPWTAQTWYPLLLENLVENPIKIPTRQKLLSNPKGEIHPLLVNKTLKLVAWRISGKICKTREYQRGLQNLSVQPEVLGPEKIITQHGGNSIAGALGEKLIPFDVMFQAS